MGAGCRSPLRDLTDTRPRANRRPRASPHGELHACGKRVAVVREEVGAGDGIRTRDILLGKQTLCQLSYSRSGARGAQADLHSSEGPPEDQRERVELPAKLQPEGRASAGRNYLLLVFFLPARAEPATLLDALLWPRRGPASARAGTRQGWPLTPREPASATPGPRSTHPGALHGRREGHPGLRRTSSGGQGGRFGGSGLIVAPRIHKRRLEAGDAQGNHAGDEVRWLRGGNDG